MELRIWYIPWNGRDPISCRTTYIEYRSPVKILISFWGTPPNSIGFHCKIVFFIVLRHRSWGVPFGEPEKLIFWMQYKKKLIISGDLFLFLKRSSLGTSDIQGCYSPKGITYMIYTLIHGRDPIPWRITYIEFRSPVKIFISFLRNTTQFHLFSLQNMFFFHSSPRDCPSKTRCNTLSMLKSQLSLCGTGLNHRRLQQSMFLSKTWKDLFSWIKMDSRKYSMYMLFFSDSGRCFYSMYRCFYRFREMLLRPKLSILYSMYPIGII